MIQNNNQQNVPSQGGFGINFNLDYDDDAKELKKRMATINISPSSTWWDQNDNYLRRRLGNVILSMKDDNVFLERNACFFARKKKNDEHWSWFVFPSFSDTHSHFNFKQEGSDNIFKIIVTNIDYLMSYSKMMFCVATEIFFHPNKQKNVFQNIDFIKMMYCMQKIHNYLDKVYPAGTQKEHDFKNTQEYKSFITNFNLFAYAIDCERQTITNDIKIFFPQYANENLKLIAYYSDHINNLPQNVKTNLHTWRQTLENIRHNFDTNIQQTIEYKPQNLKNPPIQPTSENKFLLEHLLGNNCRIIDPLNKQAYLVKKHDTIQDGKQYVIIMNAKVNNKYTVIYLYIDENDKSICFIDTQSNEKFRINSIDISNGMAACSPLNGGAPKIYNLCAAPQGILLQDIQRNIQARLQNNDDAKKASVRIFYEIIVNKIINQYPVFLNNNNLCETKKYPDVNIQYDHQSENVDVPYISFQEGNDQVLIGANQNYNGMTHLWLNFKGKYYWVLDLEIQNGHAVFHLIDDNNARYTFQSSNSFVLNDLKKKIFTSKVEKAADISSNFELALIELEIQRFITQIEGRNLNSSKVKPMACKLNNARQLVVLNRDEPLCVSSNKFSKVSSRTINLINKGKFYECNISEIFYMLDYLNKEIRECNDATKQQSLQNFQELLKNNIIEHVFYNNNSEHKLRNVVYIVLIAASEPKNYNTLDYRKTRELLVDIDDIQQKIAIDRFMHGDHDMPEQKMNYYKQEIRNKLYDILRSCDKNFLDVVSKYRAKIYDHVDILKGNQRLQQYDYNDKVDKTTTLDIKVYEPEKPTYEDEIKIDEQKNDLIPQKNIPHTPYGYKVNDKNRDIQSTITFNKKLLHQKDDNDEIECKEECIISKKKQQIKRNNEIDLSSYAITQEEKEKIEEMERPDIKWWVYASMVIIIGFFLFFYYKSKQQLYDKYKELENLESAETRAQTELS